MKWTPENIHCGMWVTKPVTRGKRFIPDGWRAKWMDMICWDATATRPARYRRVSIADGMVGMVYTAEQLALRLNEDGMIPAPDAWVRKMVTWMGREQRDHLEPV